MMKKRRKRTGAFLLALLMLVSTCLADLPDGSLSFLGDIGEKIVSVFSGEEVEAASSTTKITLTSKYGSASISEISRYSEGMWFFTRNSDTGSKKTVFCMNSGKSLSGNDTYQYTTVSAVKYSNQSLAKAMTWWFGSTSRNCMAEGAYDNGSSYGSLTAAQTQAAVQAYVWATCTSGASKETTVKQVLQNYCGLSSKKASSYARSIVNAISSTYVYGTIYYYTLSSCGHSSKKGADKHQTMLSWSSDSTTPKTGAYSTSDTETGSVTITIEIDKKDKSTGSLIDTAVFQATYGSKKLANAKKISISSGSITSASVDVTTGTYDSSASQFTTSGGKVKFTFTVKYKTNTYTTSTYRYVKNWDDLDYWTQKKYTDDGYYQNLSKAKSAAKNELKSGLSKYVSKVETSIRSKTLTVEEKSAPKGHGLSATSTLSKTAKNSLSLTYTFSNPAKYGKVTVVKKEGDTSGYDKAYSPMKGAVYGVYAAETIYDTDNTKVLYSANEKITQITTDSTGTASTKNILPVGYSYYVKEIKAPEGWEIDTQKHEFTIELGSDGKVKSATVTSTEDHEPEMKYGKVSVIKTSKRGSAYISEDATLKGAVYTVYAAETIYDVDGTTVLYKNGAKVTSFSTDSTGFGQSGEVIPAGDDSNGYAYTLVETSASTGYVVNTTKLSFYVKVDAEGNVTVRDANGNTVNGSFASGNALKSEEESIWGYVAVNKYTQDPDGTTKQEASAVFYIVDYDAVLTATGTSTLTEVKSLLKDMTTEERQKLIELIRDTDASAIRDQLTTGSSGYAKSGILAKGSYMLIQTVGTQDYSLEQYYFSITKDSGKTYTYNIYNKKTAAINITKMKSSRDTSGNLVEEAEQGAVFYVLYASGISSSLDDLNAMTASERQAYVDGLDASVICAVLTTDENGEASVDVDAGTTYIILQTYGDPYCALAYPDQKTFAADEWKTYYYDAVDPEPHSKFSITKTLVNTLGEEEGAEAGAVFAVIKEGNVTKTAEDLDAMTASERKSYVAELEDTDSSCILAMLSTDANGEASAYWNDSDYTGDFVVIQISGTEGYALMPAQYSADAQEAGSSGTSGSGSQGTSGTSAGAVMTVESGTDSDGLGYTYYAFSYADRYEGDLEFSITKRLSDANGNDTGAEEGAAFAVLKASCVMLSADEINAMTEDERKIYVNGRKAEDASCVLAEIVTDSEGDASATWNERDYDGDFVVIQTAGEDGYALMPVLYSAEATETGVDLNGATVLRVSSDGKITSYEITYTDSFVDWGKIAVQKKYEAGNGVWENESGAKFTVLDEAGDEVAWITTDSTGYGAALDADGNEAALAFGIYYVRQTSRGTGAENTDLADDELVILTQSERKQTVTYEALNPAENYELTVTKLSDDTGAPVADATYTITAAEDILGADGSVEYKSGAVVATVVTNEDGQGSTWIPYGCYYIEESASPYNFVKSTEIVYFTIDSSGITVSGGNTSAAVLTTETDEDGNETTYYSVSYTTYDTPVYGTIYVTKDGQAVSGIADEGGFIYSSEALEGAVFALYAFNDITDDAGNVVWKADTYITSATTDATGKAQFLWDKDGDGIEECVDFYLGDYYVVETYAPDGFVYDESKHTLTLTWDKTPGDQNELAEAGSVGDTGESSGSDIPYESSGKYVLTTGSTLNGWILDAKTVTFTWSSPASGTKTTDVSHDGDGSVVMWSDGSGNYYISTQDNRQAVIFNGDSSHMFDSCESLTELRFDSVDTSQVCDMSYMFYMCTGLTELDLTNFDTTNVGYFDYMFAGCTNLVTIYVQEPNGSTVESSYSTGTWTTGVTAEASGALEDGETITWENFSYTRLYTADYIVEDVQEDITLTASDIASVTPSVASQDDASVQWIDSDTYTIEVVITLSDSCAYYCTDGSYSNTLNVTVTVEIPGEIEVETQESPMAELAVSNTPITVSIEVKKEDQSGNALAGAIFTLYANCDIINADGEIIAKAGDCIMDSETLGETAPVMTFSGLPTDMYAVDGTYLEETGNAVYCYADGTTQSTADGKSMFYVKETTPPAGYASDGKTYYLTGALSDYENGWTDEDGDGIITYSFTAINTKLSYLTLQKTWDDAGQGMRPEYVCFRATASGKTSYVIVIYEDRAYLFANSGVGLTVYNSGVTSQSQLSSAICYWDTQVSAEGAGTFARTVWSVVLGSSFTLVSGSRTFSSPFTADSGYTFTENTALLKSMTAVTGTDEYYTLESEGWTNMDQLVWRATNYYPYDTESDEPEGKITIIKYSSDGQTPLAGVTYTISTEDGKTVDTQVTDENGQVVFDNLELGTYRICETATVSGYSLLAEEITATIPLVLTQSELDAYEAQGVYVNTADATVKNGKYYFYELTYEVTDTWNFDMPLSGSRGTMPMGVFAMALFLILAALLLNRKNHSGIFQGSVPALVTQSKPEQMSPSVSEQTSQSKPERMPRYVPMPQMKKSCYFLGYGVE